MCADSSFRKSGSPRVSTEVTSLQQNKLQNKEALEKGLRCRRSVKELVNQGILLSPSISHPDKVRQLQRAKTSDLLKHKIEKRPDRQQLVNRRIIRDDKPGTSPYILEQCHNLEKYQLKTALNSKLTTRPGTLELVEKGVLQVDPGVDSLIRCGSISYPRVQDVSSSGSTVSTIADPIPAPPPLVSIKPSPLPATSSGKFLNSSRGKSTNRYNGRSMKDETVVCRLGSLTFHNYCPKSAQALSPNVVPPASFPQKQKAREVQQMELLRLQDTARVHRLVEQELSKRVTARGEKPLVDGLNLNFDSKSVILEEQSRSPTVVSASPFHSPMSVAASDATQNIYSPESASMESSVTQTTIGYSVPGSSDACTLENLTLLQLKGECRERKLTVSGCKSVLIRQLEPYREQIQAKYTIGLDFKPIKNVSDNNQSPDTQLSLASSFLQQYPLLQPKLSSPTVVPMPAQPIPTLVHDFNSTAFSSAFIPTNNSFVFCSANPMALQRQSQFNQAVDSFTPTHISSSSTSNDGVSLRHSCSAPQIVDVFPSHSTAQQNIFQTPSVSIPSCASTSLILVQVANTATVTTLPSGSLPSCATQMISSISSTNTCPQSMVLLTSGVVPIQQSQTAVSTSVSFQSTTSCEVRSLGLDEGCFVSPERPDSRSRRESCIASIFPNESQQGFGSVTQSTNSTTQFSRDSIPYTDQMVESATPCENSLVNQPPTLGQIEQYWLRVRHLRRQIAKEQTVDSQATVKQEDLDLRRKQLHELVEEHDRLAVLCRLLIIERIDALDELVDSGMESNNSDNGLSSNRCSKSSLCPGTPSSGLQVERNLMYSYLRKLGGTALVNSLSSPVRFRRSSSPLNKPATEHTSSIHNTYPEPSSTVSSCVTSTPRFHCDSDVQLLGGSQNRMHLASSWSNGLQTLHNTAVPDCNDGQAKEVTDANTEPLEPPPSPLNTDALFELWNSVLKDNTETTNDVSADNHRNKRPYHTSTFLLHPETMDIQPDALENTKSSVMDTLPAVHLCTEPKKNIPSQLTHTSIPAQPVGVESSFQNMDRSSHATTTHFISGRIPFPLACSDGHNQANPIPCSAQENISAQTAWSSFIYPKPSPASTDPLCHRSALSSEAMFPHHCMPPMELADALFTSLDTTEFAELMDTAEPIGLSPLAMNWTVDA